MRQLKQLTQNLLAGLRVVGPANNPEVIATVCNLDIKTALNVAEVFVELTDEVSEPGVIFRLQYQVPADNCVSQSGD